ncbi:hypothetical protein [Amycolatopsis sp. NBC_00438]
MSTTAAAGLNDRKPALEPGQAVTPHGVDRGPDPDELRSCAAAVRT